MQIEENFRDNKSARFGFSLDLQRCKCTDRLAVLVMIGTLAHTLLTFIGLSGVSAGLHRQFQAITGVPGLDQIHMLVQAGQTETHAGFHARNSHVARYATHMLALTTAHADAYISGGTLDTWNKFNGELRRHVSVREHIVPVGEHHDRTI